MNRKALRYIVLVAAIAWLGCVIAACGAKIEGTYSNANGLVMLDLKSGGKADLTMMGDAEHCTYTADGKKIIVNCVGNTVDFAINGDGSLTGPGFIGVTRKAKS